MNTTIFRDRLQELMADRGMNNADLARAIKSTEATMSRYINLERTPNPDHIIRIADYFHVSIDWLFGRDESAYDGIPLSQYQFIQRYAAASDADRRIVNQILDKYK